MDPNKFMKLGEHIDIEIDGKQYKTDVQDIEKDGICVSQPMLRQAPVYMPQHAEIKVVYYRPDGMFEFMATNMGPAEHPTVRMIRLKILGEPRKYQRRMSFRIPLRIPVAVVVQSELTRTARTVTSFQTESIDLSESGMGIYAPQSYPLEARVRVDFYITLEGAQEQLSLVSDVARCTWPQRLGEQFVLGVRFVNISEKTQRLLSKYIIQEQIRMRRRAMR